MRITNRALVLAITLSIISAGCGGSGGGTNQPAPLDLGGKNIVGFYNDSSGKAHGFLFNGSTYTTIDNPLSSQGPTGTILTGISGSTIVGYYQDVTGNYHGFSYNGVAFTPIVDPQSGLGTSPNGVSGSRIVGNLVGGPAFLYDGTSFTMLAFPQAKATSASGISGSNIVGGYSDSTSRNHGFLYNGAAYTTLDDPMATYGTAPMGISGNDVVGFYNVYNGTTNNVEHGFLYDGSKFITIDDPLATGGPINSTRAYGISGQDIVGIYDSNTGIHGFLYDGSRYVTIDDPHAHGTSSVTGIG